MTDSYNIDSYNIKSCNNVNTPGIPDSLFCRGNVPMSKEEIRVLSLSKLRLSSGSVVADVGAGTGSVTVECARFVPNGMVYAVEKNPEAVKLLQENCRLFGLSQRVKIIRGEAPDALNSIPGKIDSVFIGGSGGHINEIISWGEQVLEPGGRLVINALLMESFYCSLNAMKNSGLVNLNFMSVSIAKAKKLGTGHALNPLNPVFILWAEKKL